MTQKINSLIYVIAMISIIAFITPTQATILNLEYVEGFKYVNLTSNDTLYINIPAGNIIDSIVYKPIFLAGKPGTYTISQQYYVNDISYTDTFESEIEISIFHIFTNKYSYNVRHMMNSELEYHKAYETYVSKLCWFPIKINSFFGSHASEDENKVTVESEIFGSTGIKRATDIYSTYNAPAYSGKNYTISHSGFDELDIVIVYKIVGIHTVDYYIGQLSPTLKNLYKLGFSWMDKELYILNLFIITDKLISMIMFWISIISRSFIPLLFIIIVFVVPSAAFYNSKNRNGFVTNLGNYYMCVVNITLSFVRYIVMIIMRVLEIVRSLIPWI